MSRPRGGAAVPLGTLVVSFVLVLGLGGWLGASRTPEAPGSALPTLAGSALPTLAPTSHAVRIVIEDLSGDQVLEPFPGLRLTISPAAATGKSPGSSGSAQTVEVCVTANSGWIVTGPGWPAPDGQNGSDPVCRVVARTAGKIEPVEILLEQR